MGIWKKANVLEESTGGVSTPGGEGEPRGANAVGRLTRSFLGVLQIIFTG